MIQIPCHMTKGRHLVQVFAVILTAILLGSVAAGFALSPPPGTSIVNTVSLHYHDANGSPLPEISSTASVATQNARTQGRIELADANWQPVYGFMHGDSIYLQVKDADRNSDPAVAESVSVSIKNLTSGDTETVILTETGTNTGVFRSSGILTTMDSASSGDGKLSVTSNSRIQATYTDPLDDVSVATASALIDPLGTVFDSVSGTPVAGTVVTLRNWSGMSNSCDLTSVPLLPPGQINPALPTGADGRFAFPLVPAGDYCFQVVPVLGHLFPSSVTDADLPAGFVIGNGSRGEKFTMSIGDPPLIRDIPVDPPVGTLAVVKSANKSTAAIGDLVAYSLRVTNGGVTPVKSIAVTDIMPHGVQYLPGSSRLNGLPVADPHSTMHRTFVWDIPDIGPGQFREITYRAVVGPDSRQGDAINTAFAAGSSSGKKVVSNTAAVKIKVSEGVFSQKGTILGKVFHDRDGNRQQNQSLASGGESKPDEPGIANVVLYLEDGTRVITDKNGKFSLLGITPGTHVLRLDETTLPKGMVTVPLSNRFLGDGASQFIVMPQGGLVQADFAVENGETLPASSPVQESAPSSGGAVKSSPMAITTTEMQPETAPSAGGSSSDGSVTGGAEATVSSEPAVSVPETVTPAASGGDAAEKPPSPLVKSGADDWEAAIKAMSPDLDFLNPADGTVSNRERIRVVFKSPLGTETTLFVNGVPVSSRQIGRKFDYEKGQVALFEYIDIHLNAGEANLLKVEAKDPFGIVRGSKEITVTAAGAPERIVIAVDKSEVPADGTSVIHVDVSTRDRNNRIVPYAALATVSISAGEIVEKDADPKQENFQIVLKDGRGQFTLRAPRETGEGAIAIAVDGRQEIAKVFFVPHLRNLFLVGMGEVKIGLGHGSGNYSFLKDSSWFDNGLYANGRAAFFLKDKVFDDILLTAAFDSEKKKQDDLFRENDTRLDSEDKYPIYGDESKSGYEAVSADKLYVKLEKNRSSLLYGDYRTDLNDTRLSAYNRTFNGVKYELNTEPLKLRSFGSYTDQTQVVDTLPGKGISGFYYLTRRTVVEGAERVVIETRDRYRSDIVLSREVKSRGSDYEIDYDLGALLFKAPVPSYDANYNPIYIIVSYESRTNGEKYLIYGGRGAYKPFVWLELGATGVIEEKAIGDYRLTGTDLTLTLPRQTVIKAEYARTKAVLEEASLFAWRSDSAWSVNMASEPLEKLHLTGYYRTLGNYFLNPSAVDATRGATRYGLDALYNLPAETTVHGRFYDERDDLNSMDHRLVSLGIQKKIKKTTVTGEVSNESSSNNYIPLADPKNRSPFNISQDTPHDLTELKLGVETEIHQDLSLLLNHRQSLTQENFHSSQAGLNYRLNSQNRLYLREEYQKVNNKSESRALFGAETQLLKNTVAFNEYRLADGADGTRNQNVMGIRNTFYLGKNLTGNASAEYLKTLSGSQRTSEPDSFAGTVGAEYLASDQVKVTGRFEHRRELIGSGKTSYLGETGFAYKLNPDYSLLLRERYFTEDAGAGRNHTASRTMVGIAYRPLLTNRFNALTKMEYKHESDTASIPRFREEAWILSSESVWQASPRLQLAARYAGKLSRDDVYSSYTDLIAARFVYDLTNRWDVGAEYRLLTSHAVNTSYQGGAAEIGYRVIKNLWIAAGYSFDKFDADLSGDSYQGEGPYIKIRVKFDENSVHNLRK